MLVPRSPDELLEATVTILVADLYDYLTRHEEEPMPDMDKATTVRKVKRGWRRVSMNLRLQEYDFLARMAEDQERTPDQQAAYLLRQKLEEINDEALSAAALTGNGRLTVETAADPEAREAVEAE